MSKKLRPVIVHVGWDGHIERDVIFTRGCCGVADAMALGAKIEAYGLPDYCYVYG